MTKDSKLEIIRAIAQATIAVLQRTDLSKCYLDHQRTQLGCALVLLNKLWKYESIGRVLVAELIEQFERITKEVPGIAAIPGVGQYLE